MEFYFDAFKRFADFDGRSNREEYWMFVLINMLVALLLVFIDVLMFGSSAFFYFGYLLLSIIPSISLAIRRLHDTGRSGWYLLMSFIPFIGGIALLVFFLEGSKEGNNQYGENYSTRERDEFDDLLDAPIGEDGFYNSIQTARSDAFILVFLVWSGVISTTIWATYQYWDEIIDTMIISNLTRFVWIGMTFLLAFAIQDRSKRTIALVIASISGLYSLYTIGSQILNTM